MDVPAQALSTLCVPDELLKKATNPVISRDILGYVSHNVRSAHNVLISYYSKWAVYFIPLILQSIWSSLHVLFLFSAFDILLELYKQADISVEEAVKSILSQNIFGADIDEIAVAARSAPPDLGGGIDQYYNSKPFNIVDNDGEGVA